MTLKPGVKLKGLQPQALVGLTIAEGVFRNYGLEMVVTSVNDSRHSLRSLHYKGQAFDLRLPTRCEKIGHTAPFYDDLDERVWRDIKEACGAEFDVILETHQMNRFQHHIHVEYDPK